MFKKELEKGNRIESKNNLKNELIKYLFILISILFAMPSIIYLIQKKTSYPLEPYFQFLYDMPVNRLTQTWLYILLLASLTFLYFRIVKRRKEIFQDTKKMFLWIAIIALIFVAVLPFTCSDVFYYLGIGRINSTYHQNPYYITIKEFVEQDNNKQFLQTDTILATRL